MIKTSCDGWVSGRFYLKSSVPYFGPAIVVFIDAHAFATNDALKKPCRDNFGSWILKSFNVIENSVVELFDEREDLCVHLSKVFHEAARIELATDNDIHPIVMAVHVLALVTVRYERKMMSGFEAVGSTDTRFQFAHCTARAAEFWGFRE